MASTQNTIPRRPLPNPLNERRAKELTEQFRQMLSTRRMNELSRQNLQSRESEVYPHIDRDYGTAIYTAPSSSRNSPSGLRNLPLMPEAPTSTRAQKFRSLLHGLSQLPLKWENPGLLDEALRVVPLQQIYNEAEEESNVYKVEAESLGPRNIAAWGYQDCVIRSLLRWFKRSFFSFVYNPACNNCGNPTVGIGMAAPTQDESARGASSVELYQCNTCKAYERFPRYNDAFVLLQTRRGRVGEWAQCFGMLCRAMGSRVRWIWNSEDHVWIEVYSVHRKRWIHVDPCEQAWDKPKLYTEGWNRKIGYCIAFSADGVCDVTRRYVRNYSKHAAKRERASEATLLYILNEIRSARRRDLNKDDKFRLEGEDMRESKELRYYSAQAIAAEVCSIIVGQSTPPKPKPDADAAKALEAQLEQGQQRSRSSNPSGTTQDPHDPYQQPPRSR